jgi:hypothetical protein
VKPPVHHLLLAGRAPGGELVDAALAGQVGGDDPLGEPELDVYGVAAFSQFAPPLPADRGVLAETGDRFRRPARADELGIVQREERLGIAAVVRVLVGTPDIGIQLVQRIRIR